MKLLWTTKDDGVAHVLKDYLQQEGIKATVMVDQTHIQSWLAPATRPSSQVYVLKEHLPLARQLLAKFIEELGSADAAADEEWTCPNCGEMVDGNFQICWNCNHDRPEAQAGEE